MDMGLFLIIGVVGIGCLFGIFVVDNEGRNPLKLCIVLIVTLVTMFLAVITMCINYDHSTTVEDIKEAIITQDEIQKKVRDNQGIFLLHGDKNVIVTYKVPVEANLILFKLTDRAERSIIISTEPLKHMVDLEINTDRYKKN